MDDSMEESAFLEGDSSPPAPKPKVTARGRPKKSDDAPAKPKASKAPKAPKGTKITTKKLTQTTLKTVKPTAKKRAKPESDDENSDMESPDRISLNDDSLLSNTPPSAKKQKKAPPPKKSSGKPLQSIENESFDMDGSNEPKPKNSDNATDRYQKLTQLEHILKRPDTYIGSVERDQKQMWVYNSVTESMEFREISFVPGLYKIFDEILVNAADNKQRDKNMDEMKVTVDRETGEITVRNNGRGIPIEIHEKEGIYVPEMIFGHLLTSSNYDDEEQKVTGGRNGYGAKLCNIFSVEFTVETADAKAQKKYKQTWKNNMGTMGAAKITPCKGDDYTKISFVPDFKKFNMTEMDDDFEALVKRRVYDLAGTCKGVKVYLNGEKIKVNNFKKYMEMYTRAIKTESGGGNSEDGSTGETQIILTDKPHERWEVGFAVSDGSFQQVSFVNSIATTSGGTHVNFISDQIVTKLLAEFKKKNKGSVALKNAQIRNHIFLFVNCLIVNPAFTSQTKEQLTTKATQFGSKPELNEKFLKQIIGTEVMQNIQHFAQQKADQILKKSDGNKRSRMNNAKLTDANKAGTKDGYRCTLILTEGDSASGLALAGRAVVNPDLFGVFPLRGKILNVRDASIEQISKNQEIQNIKKFMGLQHKKEYTDTKSLRYGHLMIMTDQDHDGSHIKGLLINFLQVQFPSLLKIDGFLLEFITPIVKVFKGDFKYPKQLRSFFTMPEYEAWKQEPGHQKGWEHKYYKGLGTSDPNKDGQEYFRDLDRHLKEFHVMKDKEAEMIDLAFSKKKADARKNWLRDFVPGTFLDMTAPKISYDDFINKELILFSMADNLRSIPSVIDGFKPGQRKVLYASLRRNIKKEMKVVDFAGMVSTLTAYAYGESSLQQTIVGLAQNFVGSNNVNFLEPSGNFGSRLQGGNDAASSRYIYTRLSPFARKVFHATDEPLLRYHEDDGKTIEPEVYVPIVPMILINGADGIGTGWSTSIPNYKPEDVVDNLKRRMAGDSKDDMIPMKPWFRNWTGQIEDIGNDRFKFTGTIRQTEENEIEITELPIRVWTQTFKEKLEEILKAEKVPSFIKDYTEYNTPLKVHFIIKMEDKHMKIALEKGLEETFKLSTTMATSNLVAFDSQGRIHKYNSVIDIIEEFYHVRLKFYEKRKQHMLNEMQKELDKMTNQARFIQMIIDGKLVVARKKKKELVAEMKRLNFKPFPKVIDARKASETEAVVEQEEVHDTGDAETDTAASDYDYLVGMAIWSLTQERIDKLRAQIGDREEEIDTLIKLSPKDLWTKDLDDFVAEWQKTLKEQDQEEKRYAKMGRRASTKLRIDGRGKAKRKSDDDSDADFGAPKAKKAATTKASTKAAPKVSSLTNYLMTADQKKSSSDPMAIDGVSDETTTAGASIPVEKKSKATASKPAVSKAKKPAKIIDSDEEDKVISKPVAPRTKKPSKIIDNDDESVAPKPKKSTKVLNSDDEDDVFAAVAKEASTRPTARQARNATKAPIRYDIPSDSDNEDGDDMLGDVSAMVKGIGSSSNENTRTLFSASTAARPTSGHGLSKSLARPTLKSTINISDDDETDYTKLVPQPSPQRPAARNANDTILSDDDDDTLLGLSKPPPPKALKQPAKPAAKAAAKPAPKPVVKKAAAAPQPKKVVPLSPAAKAYAAKQAKASLSKPAPKKKNVESESEEDVDDIANEILSDDGDEDEEDAVVVRKPAAVRPGRAAARKPAKYVVSDDEEDEESEADFDDDDESD
ncbi:type II DNA topoisomerase [Patellaria atrata CBS 101060]|uniref:DNA topoisomerase 2 n=1 Tax=Patellaria atrata CBS 101060 TaxID=1346257 RepID=A0A9P4VSM9_9PEZI|nr:type II DNA topoisomerase [Patellaria atrata CBS 101060]